MLVLGDFRLQPVADVQYRTRMPPDLGPGLSSAARRVTPAR